jgi:hypothetical protein
LSCFSNVCVEVPDGALASSGGVSGSSGGAGSSSGGSSSGPEIDAAPPGDDGGGGGSSGGGEDGGGPPDSPVSTGTNLVTNGDFSQGTMFWSLVSGNGMVTANAGELCVAVGANSSVTLGWPEPSGTPGAVLTTGSYTFTYTSRATVSGVTVDAKIGQSVSPYAADYESKSDPASMMAQPTTHQFVAMNADSSAGIAFAFTLSQAGQVCFQKVSLVKN